VASIEVDSIPVDEGKRLTQSIYPSRA
jgi:hypothetical protein